VHRASPVDELFLTPSNPYTKALLAANPEPDISSRNKRVEIIKGELTSPVNQVPDVVFAKRCNYVFEQCTREDPPLINLEKEHYCACFLHKNEVHGLLNNNVCDMDDN
jgi:oligopeptide/dipeptide ABC transporter ATP-binding protein